MLIVFLLVRGYRWDSLVARARILFCVVFRVIMMFCFCLYVCAKEYHNLRVTCTLK